MPPGVSKVADVAGPPSPVLPEVPVPATGLVLPGSQATATKARTATTAATRRIDRDLLLRARIARTLPRRFEHVPAGPETPIGDAATVHTGLERSAMPATSPARPDDVAASPTVVVTGAAGWLGQNLVRALAPERTHGALPRAATPSRRRSSRCVGPRGRDRRRRRARPGRRRPALRGLGPADRLPRRRRHPPRRPGARAVRRQRRRHRSWCSTGARRAGAAPVRPRLVELALRRQPHRTDALHRGLAVQPVPALRRSRRWRPSSSCAAAPTRRPRRPSSSARRGSTARTSPPARPSSSARAARAASRLVGDGTQRRSMVYTGNLVQGLLRGRGGRRRPRAAPTGSPTPSPTSCATMLATVRDALAAEGFTVSPPPAAHARASPRYVAEHARPRRSGRGRYVQALHVLGELKDTIACDIARARAELGYEPETALLDGHAGQHPLVHRAGRAALSGRVGPRHRRQRLLRRPCSPARRSPRGDEVRDLRPNPPDDHRPRDVEFVQATSATGTRSRARVRRRRRGPPQRRPGAARQGPRAVPSRSTWSARPTCCSRARDAGVGKVVHTSSSAVFGIPDANPVDRGRPPAARSRRTARAKLEAEGCATTRSRPGLDVTIVRPRTILGHGRLGILAILFEFVADGAPVFVLGTGDNRYQFVHADDLADAVPRAPASARARDRTTSARREFGTMRETLQALVDHAGTGSQVRSLPARPRPRRDERPRRSPAWRRSRRTTGCSTASRCGST